MYIILVYDFGENRVAKALKTCRKYLTWVQNSVFEGEITEGNLKKLKVELENKMDKDVDSLIIYTLSKNKYIDKEIIGYEKNKPSVFF